MEWMRARTFKAGENKRDKGQGGDRFTYLSKVYQGTDRFARTSALGMGIGRALELEAFYSVLSCSRITDFPYRNTLIVFEHLRWLAKGE